MPDWDEDSDRLSENLKRAYQKSRDHALSRVVPSVDIARQWHVITMDGLDAPEPQYIGNFRGEAGLEGCEVRVAGYPGTPSSLVSGQLTDFEIKVQKAVHELDKLIPHGEVPSDADDLNAVIELCAWVHSEWVRIHPFANGNGRTARIWTGFIAMRYGLPPFVRLRPRPDGGYGSACGEAMKGDWGPTAQVFRQMYIDTIRGSA